MNIFLVMGCMVSQEVGSGTSEPWVDGRYNYERFPGMKFEILCAVHKNFQNKIYE